MGNCNFTLKIKNVADAGGLIASCLIARATV